MRPRDRGDPPSPWAWPLALSLGAMLGLGCGASASSLARPRAVLWVSCPVPTARIYVDDVFVGRVGELASRGIAVGAGTRRIEVRADGFFTAYSEAELAPAGKVKVAVPLREIPEHESGG